MRVRLLAAEKYAIFAFLLLCLLNFADAEIYSRFWVLGMGVVALVWVIVLIVAVASVIWAFKDHHPPLDALRAAAAMPIAIVVAILTAPLATWCAGLLYLNLHESEFVSARLSAPPGTAAAIPYIQGIPDGGVAIIETRGFRPETLPQTEMLRLTGERIKRCRPLRGDYYLCGYD